MTIKDIRDIIESVERVTKSGHINFIIKDERELGSERIDNELVLDYTTSPGYAMLKVVKDGETHHIHTEANKKLEELLSEILKVGDGSDLSNYSPSIYYKIYEGDKTSGSYYKDRISYFYNEIKNNPDLTPNFKQVKYKDEDFTLVDFTTTSHIYLNLSEIFEPNSTEDIRTLTSILYDIYSKINELKTDFEAMIDYLDSKIDNMKDDFDAIDNSQDSLIGVMEESINKNTEEIERLEEEVNEYLEDSERRVRPIEFILTHSEEAVIPVLFTIGGGIEVNNNLQELFLASIYISSPNSEVLCKIGNDLLWEGGTYEVKDQTEFIIVKNKADATWIYDVVQIDNNKFIVYMRTGAYVVFNKYIENLTIEPKYEEYLTYTIKPIDTVINNAINGTLYNNRTYTKRFSSGINIARTFTINDVEFTTDVIR